MTGVWIGCGILLFVLCALVPVALVAGAGRVERERRATVEGEALRDVLRGDR